MKCPDCKGDGDYYNPVLWMGLGGGERCVCDMCEGIGKISLRLWLRYKISMWRYKKL